MAPEDLSVTKNPNSAYSSYCNSLYNCLILTVYVYLKEGILPPILVFY